MSSFTTLETDVKFQTVLYIMLHNSAWENHHFQETFKGEYKPFLRNVQYFFFLKESIWQWDGDSNLRSRYSKHVQGLKQVFLHICHSGGCVAAPQAVFSKHELQNWVKELKSQLLQRWKCEENVHTDRIQHLRSVCDFCFCEQLSQGLQTLFAKNSTHTHTHKLHPGNELWILNGSVTPLNNP